MCGTFVTDVVAQKMTSLMVVSSSSSFAKIRASKSSRRLVLFSASLPSYESLCNGRPEAVASSMERRTGKSGERWLWSHWKTYFSRKAFEASICCSLTFS
eukprot:17909_2